MRYMSMVKHLDDMGGEPSPALFEDMEKLVTAGFADGSLVDAGGLSPSERATEVRLSGGEVTVTNGPWSETKEVVGGYAIIEARSQEEAVALARQMIDLHVKHWPGVEVACEVRAIDG